jgi:hypothetical protein
MAGAAEPELLPDRTATQPLDALERPFRGTLQKIADRGLRNRDALVSDLPAEAGDKDRVERHWRGGVGLRRGVMGSHAASFSATRSPLETSC